MFTNRIRIAAWAALPIGLAFAACGDETIRLAGPVVDIVNATSEECANGGRTIRTGIDANLNGILDDAEVNGREPVCAGADGGRGSQGIEGTNALLRTTDEPAGANCAEGGVRIEVGLDEDGDGNLAAGEVDQTSFVCDGLAGQPGLSTVVRTRAAPMGACESGAGLEIQWGLDANRDEVLQDNEVNDGLTQIVCDGEDGVFGIFNIVDEPAGPNCLVGGRRVESGLDENRSGDLDPSEITSVEYVCDVVSTLVRVSAELAGVSTACPAGGTRLQTGPDINMDNVLGDTEVTDTTFVCSGVDGQQTLVTVTAEPAGTNCAAGGQRIQTGVDTSGDGVLDAAEITATSFICNGAQGADGSGGNAVRVSSEPAGANCPSGGTRIETGPDSNGNGALDDTEVTNTTFSCRGAAVSTLVTTATIGAGSSCASGGVRIDSGTDDNNNGVLDVAEVDTTQFVCNTVGTSVPFGITTLTLPGAFVGFAYDEVIEALGGTGGSYRWSVISGSLPPGLSLAPTGTPASRITGTSTQAGTFAFTVSVTDFFGQSATRAFSITYQEPPCRPGAGGLVSDAATTVSIALAPTLSSGFGIAADEDPNGWLYIVGTTELTRVRKDGSASEDLESNAALSSLNLGYDVEFSGNDIYVLDDSSSSTSGRLQRISSDGGVTFSVQDMATFPSTGNPDDFRGMAVDGSTIYLVTQGSSDTEIWSVDISGNLPAAASLVGTFTGIFGCEGLEVDRSYFYTVCSNVVRIGRTTLEVETLTTSLGVSSTYNAPVAQDADGDGITDVLWVHGFDDMVFVCDPSGSAPFFAQPFGETESNADYGVALDQVNNQLWRFDDSPDELYRYD